MKAQKQNAGKPKNCNEAYCLRFLTLHWSAAVSRFARDQPQQLERDKDV